MNSFPSYLFPFFPLLFFLSILTSYSSSIFFPFPYSVCSYLFPLFPFSLHSFFFSYFLLLFLPAFPFPFNLFPFSSVSLFLLFDASLFSFFYFLFFSYFYVSSPIISLFVSSLSPVYSFLFTRVRYFFSSINQISSFYLQVSTSFPLICKATGQISRLYVN